MSIDKVQLQQQEIVNNEVVLTDINPITSTDSVFDVSTGSTMQETLDRIWNAINNRLARYVNSVNNKTGVVVLDPSDVGLNKVDNVSFNEIKQWVIDYFKSMMANYQLRLFEDFQEAQNLLLTQDQSLNSVPFYAEKYENEQDYRAYIGYYYWDETDEELKMEWKTINVVGKTDASIKYDKGEVSVRIHPDETALYVDTGIDMDHSGLRINPDVFASKLIECKCLYGELNDTDRMLSAYDATDDDHPVRIFIDGVEVTTTHGHHLHKKWTETLHENQQILTSFDKFYTGGAVSGNPQLIGTNATFDLMNRQPAVGVVTKVPDPDTPDDDYIIQFNTIRSFTSGLGTKYYPNHTSGVVDSQLGIDFAMSESFGNESGLTAQINPNGLLTTNPANSVPHDTWNLAYRNVQPHGYFGNHGGISEEKPNHGVVVSTDESICRYPVHMYVPAGETDPSGDTYIGSKRADNWSPTAILGFEVGYEHGPNGDIEPYDQNWGYPGPATYLSVNLNKIIRDSNFTLVKYDPPHQPDDWNENYQNYWYKSAVSETDNDFIFKPLTTDTAPEWRENTYYLYNGDNGYKYHFTDISGLRLNHGDPNKFVETANSRYLDFDENDQKKIGIYDGKDSIGNPIESLPHTNVSGGLSVNVGNFLEICPKSTTTGATYEDSGKVQVRIGKGLCDDYVIDTDFEGFPDYPDGIVDGVVNFSVFNSAICPPDYYTNPENYACVNRNGNLIPVTQLNLGSYGGGIKFRTIIPTELYFSNRWSEHYTDYYHLYDIRIGYEHIPLQMSAPALEPTQYFYFGPDYWNRLYTLVYGTRVFESLVRVKRTNRISAGLDLSSLMFNDENKIKVNMDNESVRVTGGYDNESVKAYPIARPIKSTAHYYQGEIFTNDNYDTLYMVKDPNGITTGVEYSINEYIADDRVSVYKQDPDAVVGTIETRFYKKGTIIFSNDKKMAYATRDFTATGTFAAHLDNGDIAWTKAVNQQVDNKTLLYDDGVLRTNSLVIIREYDADERFVDGELFTNEAHTGVYMAKDNFTASGNINTDISAGKILVIKSPT